LAAVVDVRHNFAGVDKVKRRVVVKVERCTYDLQVVANVETADNVD